MARIRSYDALDKGQRHQLGQRVSLLGDDPTNDDFRTVAEQFQQHSGHRIDLAVLKEAHQRASRGTATPQHQSRQLQHAT